MLNPTTFSIVHAVCFAIWGFYTWRLNCSACAAMHESPDNTPYWIKKLENISGPGIVVYSLTMTAAVIYWVMSMDVTWFSSVYGLLFLVGQGYSVLALSILTSISLSRLEPFAHHPAHHRAARPRQVHLRLRHAQHLSRLRPVPHHLVRQPA